MKELTKLGVPGSWVLPTTYELPAESVAMAETATGYVPPIAVVNWPAIAKVGPTLSRTRQGNVLMGMKSLQHAEGFPGRSWTVRAAEPVNHFPATRLIGYRRAISRKAPDA